MLSIVRGIDRDASCVALVATLPQPVHLVVAVDSNHVRATVAHAVARFVAHETWSKIRFIVGRVARCVVCTEPCSGVMTPTSVDTRVSTPCVATHEMHCTASPLMTPSARRHMRIPINRSALPRTRPHVTSAIHNHASKPVVRHTSSTVNSGIWLTAPKRTRSDTGESTAPATRYKTGAEAVYTTRRQTA